METIERLSADAEAEEQTLLRQRQDEFRGAVGFSSLDSPAMPFLPVLPVISFGPATHSAS